MKHIKPQQPSHLSPYTRACLEASVKANFAERISLGGALGLFHYLDYRSTHDVDAWSSESLSWAQRQEVSQTLDVTLSAYGSVRIRAWGDNCQCRINPGWKNSVQFSNCITFSTIGRTDYGRLD